MSAETFEPTDPIDALARRAAGVLRASAARRAAALVVPPRRRRLLPVVAAIGFAGVLLAALYVVARDHPVTEPATPGRDLQWIIGDVPPEWSPGRLHPSSGSSMDGQAIYSTDAAPDGPSLLLNVFAEGGPRLAWSASNIVEHTRDGRHVVIGDGFDGRRVAEVAVDPGWCQLTATGMTDDELLDAAFATTADSARRAASIRPPCRPA